METYHVSCKKNTVNKNFSVKGNKIDYCLYQIVIFVVRKNLGSLKIKKQAGYSAN